MTKLASFLLSALLLWGLVEIRAKDNGIVAEPQPLPVSVTLVQEGTVRRSKAAKPLSLKDKKNTMWSGSAGVRLMVYEDGAYLFTANEVFAIEESEDGFLLKNELYRTPFDVAPAAVLPAGTVQITVDGDRVTLEVKDDPLGVLAFDGLDGAALTKEKYAPYRYSDFNFFSGPLEPGTEWFCYFGMGEHRYAKLTMTVGEDGAMSGTLSLPDGRKMNCALLGNDNGFALVDESGEEPELLFYGERTQANEMRLNETRYRWARLGLSLIYDPLDLCALDRFELCREKTLGDDIRYMLGRNLDSVILVLIRDGWTETKDMDSQYPALEVWFARLVKDEQTLLIHCGADASTPYEAWQDYPDAYVLYGAGGTVLSWSGSKPIDHGIADAYQLRKGVYFDPGTGVFGMDVGEDEYAYFLDDGRIAIEYTPHEGGDGDVGFEIIRVIP